LENEGRRHFGDEGRKNLGERGRTNLGDGERRNCFPLLSRAPLLSLLTFHSLLS